MKISRLLAGACLMLALWFGYGTSIAHAQSGIVILPQGCGTGSFIGQNGYFTMDSSGRLCDSMAGAASPAPYQFSSPGAMQSQLPVTTGAAVTLTPPTGATCFSVSIRSGASAINFSIDGKTTVTTGATGAGRQLSAGQSIGYCGATLIANFQAIAELATTAIDVEYTK